MTASAGRLLAGGRRGAVIRAASIPCSSTAASISSRTRSACALAGIGTIAGGEVVSSDSYCKGGGHRCERSWILLAAAAAGLVTPGVRGPRTLVSSGAGGELRLGAAHLRRHARPRRSGTRGRDRPHEGLGRRQAAGSQAAAGRPGGPSAGPAARRGQRVCRPRRRQLHGRIVHHLPRGLRPDARHRAGSGREPGPGRRPGAAPLVFKRRRATRRAGHSGRESPRRTRP